MKVERLKNAVSEIYERKTRCDLERALTLLALIGIVALAIIGGLGLREMGELAKLGRLGSLACLVSAGVIVVGLLINQYWKSKESVTKKTDLTKNESRARLDEIVNHTNFEYIQIDFNSGVAVGGSGDPHTEFPVYCVKPEHDRVRHLPLPKEGIIINQNRVSDHRSFMDNALSVKRTRHIFGQNDDLVKLTITQSFKGGTPKAAWYAPFLGIIVLKTTSGEWFYCLRNPSGSSATFHPLPKKGITFKEGGSIDKYGRIVGEKSQYLRF